MPTNMVNFKNSVPFKFGQLLATEEVRILSMPEETNTTQTFDVIYTLTVFSSDFLAIYLFWMFFVWFLFVAFVLVINGMSKETWKRKVQAKKHLWNIVQAFCEQDNFPLTEHYSINVLGLVVVVGIFFVNQYYYGYFGTDLTIAAKPTVIDTLEDLLASKRTPAVIIGDFSSAADLEMSKDPLKKNLSPANHTTDREDVTKLVNNMTAKLKAFYGMTTYQQTMLVFYCRAALEEKERNEKVEAVKNYHLGSKVFLESLRAMVMKNNISRELEVRLNWGFAGLFESGVYTKGTLQDYAQKALAYVDTPWTFEVQNCVAMRTEEPDNEVLPFATANIEVLNTYFCFGMFVALILFSFELISKISLTRPQPSQPIVNVTQNRTFSQSVLISHNLVYHKQPLTHREK